MGYLAFSELDSIGPVAWADIPTAVPSARPAYTSTASSPNTPAVEVAPSTHGKFLIVPFAVSNSTPSDLRVIRASFSPIETYGVSKHVAGCSFLTNQQKEPGYGESKEEGEGEI